MSTIDSLIPCFVVKGVTGSNVFTRSVLFSSSKYDEGPTPQSVASTDVDPNLESEPSIDSQTRDHDGANTMASSPPSLKKVEKWKSSWQASYQAFKMFVQAKEEGNNA